jgi:hypothetical protein
MASVIKIKRSTSPGSAPSSLAAGEIAVNIPDRKLFVGDGSSIYHIGGQYLAVSNAAATYATKAYAAANSYVKSTLANTNSYIATKLDSNNPVITGSLTANGSTGTAGYYLRSSATGIYWSPIAAQTQYLQVANAVATYATKAYAAANSYVKSTLANTNSYIATKANTSNPSTTGFFNHTGRLTVGTNLRVTGNTVIDGDLTVEGSVTYISSSTLNVDDSMIKLAANNAADTVDVGFYGKYVSSGTKYSGLFRDASDGIFKFYTGSQTEPGTTVDTGATGYTVATIEATIDGGTY